MHKKLLLITLSFCFLLCKSISAVTPEQLEGWTKNPGPLQAWAVLKMSENYLKNDKAKEAIELLAAVPDESSFGVWKKVNIADAYRQLGKYEEAINILSGMPEPDISLTPNQNYYFSLYKRGLLIRKAAQIQLKISGDEVKGQLWALYPGDPDLAGFISNASTQNKLSRLHLLSEMRDITGVPSLISLSEIQAANVSTDIKCRGMLEFSNSLRQLNKYQEAVDGYSALSKMTCSTDQNTKAMYWKAKLLSKLNKTADAIAAYQAFIKKYPDNRLTDDAYYALWKLAGKSGNKVLANTSYNQLMASKGDMRQDELWDEAWEKFEKKKYSDAISLLNKIISDGPGSGEYYPQALYWKARSMEKAKGKKGSSPESEAIYRKIMSEYPYSFYSVIAAARLKTSQSHPAMPSVGGSPPQDLELFQAVDELVKMGNKKDACDVLDYWTQTHPNIDAKIFMGKEWMSCGDYNQSLILASLYHNFNAADGVIKNGNAMIGALFPLAYKSIVKEAAQKVGIPRGLIHGIMREESLFKKDVSSSVGARGLMQLMPATAAEQSKASGIPLTNLADPTNNIMIGSSFLAKMVKTFDGNMPYAIMAYNAGPGNVRKWIKQNGHLPLDEFIESIPFSETRNYVKRVLRSTKLYGVWLSEERIMKFLVDF